MTPPRSLATKTEAPSAWTSVGLANWHAARSRTCPRAPVEAFMTTRAPKGPLAVVTRSCPSLTAAACGCSRWSFGPDKTRTKVAGGGAVGAGVVVVVAPVVVRAVVGAVLVVVPGTVVAGTEAVVALGATKA